MCSKNPGRHAGVAIINVDDIQVTVNEIREAHKMGLFGGVLLPTSTGHNPVLPRLQALRAAVECV